MSWLRKNWLLVASCIIVLCIAGCISSVDPATGHRLYQLDPNNGIVKFVDFVLGAVPVVAPAVTGILSVFFPYAVPVVTAIGGILAGVAAMWKNLKPKVTQAQTLATQATNLLGAGIEAFEHYKTTNPEGWECLRKKFAALLPKNSPANLDIVLREMELLLNLPKDTGV